MISRGEDEAGRVGKVRGLPWDITLDDLTEDAATCHRSGASAHAADAREMKSVLCE